MSELKPCPFHNCLTCGCYESVNIPDKDWNTRPEEERLRKALLEIANIFSKGGIRTVTMADRCVQIAQNALMENK